MKISTLASLAFAFLICAGSATSHAAIVINPTSDGSLYVCDTCNIVSDDTYLMVSGYIQGAVKFSSSAVGALQVTHAELTLNPYGLPLWGPNVDIYGYGSTIGNLDVSDANAGTFLGTLVLPNLNFGQDVHFDVTSFIANTHAPFFAFNLRTVTGGADMFSSLEYNYGHPAQLIVTTAVPEPGQLSMMFAGLLAIALVARRRPRLQRLDQRR